jgi:hypothetical protein
MFIILRNLIFSVMERRRHDDKGFKCAQTRLDDVYFIPERFGHSLGISTDSELFIYFIKAISHMAMIIIIIFQLIKNKTVLNFSLYIIVSSVYIRYFFPRCFLTFSNVLWVL